MATKVASAAGMNAYTPHTSGLYADMTLDGPEIGTLVLIVDRAKNLPNRKSMGKQNPYCAARLGKEARKTETDRRGGQTPRWDQELRFIVHDSPDYNRMKISVFSEDKRTDLVGEAWVELTDVITPGGGKKDFWQELTCKGKYAGELRIELTYYDERPRPVEPTPAQELSQMLGDVSKVKRRPLPNSVNNRNLTPGTVPEPAVPGRAKHGPRDFRAPPRANSMPVTASLPQLSPAEFDQPATQGLHGTSPLTSGYQTQQEQHYAPYDSHQEVMAYEEDQYSQHPDFLPQLPPSNRQRAVLPPRQPMNHMQAHTPPRPPLPNALALQHSASAPVVPQSHQLQLEYDDGYQLHTEFPDPIPDIDYQYQQIEDRRREVPVSPIWSTGFDDTAAMEPYPSEDDARPPPPPVHSNSSPAVPQRNLGMASSPVATYGGTPPSARHISIPNSSPLQSMERKYATPPRTSMQGTPMTSTPPLGMSPSPQSRVYDSPTPNCSPGQSPTHFTRQQPAPRMPPNRHSISDPYLTNTPPRPHPLSQEVPRSRSPQPMDPQDHYHASSPAGGNFQQHQPEYRSRDGLPLIRPRPVSPQAPQPLSQPSSAPRAKSLYDIQNPVRAFASSDNSPLSTSQHHQAPAAPSNRSTPIRKSVSPRPTPPNSAGAMPYSPDSFNVHNPHARESTLSNGNSPHSPYQIRAGSEAAPRNDADSPFVDWHGKEVDPSDHLPVDSWAPEPEKKTPVRAYGLGRDRDFGPRTPQSGGSNSASKTLSKDTVVNVRMRTQSQPASPAVATPTSFRNRLQKKTTPSSKAAQVSPVAAQPLQERHNFNSVSLPPNPYDQQQEYSAGFYGQPPPSSEGRMYQGSYAAMSEDALSREISSIDLDGPRHARSGSVPNPSGVAFVPVRSHKDRRTLY